MKKGIDIHQLPYVYNVPGTRGAGIFLLLFSLPFIGLPGIALFYGIKSGTLGFVAIIPIIFLLVGFGISLLALEFISSKTTIRFSSEEVSYHKTSLLSKESKWSEALEHYNGILRKTEVRRSGKSSYTAYLLKLEHNDSKKSITLFESNSEKGLRESWERYARIFNLPALELSEEGLVRRDVEDLDKSVRELVEEQKLQVTFDPSQKPPEGLSIEVKEEILVINVLKKQLTGLAILIVLLVPSIFIYVGFFINGGSIFFGIIGVIFAALILAGVVWESITTSQIRLSPWKIHILRITPWGETKGTIMNTTEIEQVLVKRASRGTGAAVIISTDTVEKGVGAGLDSEALEWLKNCIITVISK